MLVSKTKKGKNEKVCNVCSLFCTLIGYIKQQKISFELPEKIMEHAIENAYDLKCIVCLRLGETADFSTSAHQDFKRLQKISLDFTTEISNFHKTSKDLNRFQETSQDFKGLHESSRTSRDFTGLHGLQKTSRNFRRLHETSQNFRRLHKTSWFHGTLWVKSRCFPLGLRSARSYFISVVSSWNILFINIQRERILRSKKFFSYLYMITIVYCVLQKSHVVSKVSWIFMRSLHLLKSNEVPWSPIKSNEVRWSSMKFDEVSWNVKKSLEVRWSSMESVKSYEAPWSLLRSPEVPWSLLKSLEVLRVMVRTERYTRIACLERWEWRGEIHTYGVSLMRVWAGIHQDGILLDEHDGKGIHHSSTSSSHYVSKVSIRFEFFLSGFAILSELSLKAVELDIQLNSAWNDTIFYYCYREKNFDEGEGRGP
jgi:hypothetical protein